MQMRLANCILSRSLLHRLGRRTVRKSGLADSPFRGIDPPKSVAASQLLGITYIVQLHKHLATCIVVCIPRTLRPRLPSNRVIEANILYELGARAEPSTGGLKQYHLRP